MDNSNPKKSEKQPNEEELRKLREEMAKSLIERDERREWWKYLARIGQYLSQRVRGWRRW